MKYVIIGVGIFIAFYTVVGGFEAVIWTDLVQSIVLLLGGAFCAFYVALKLPGGLEQIIEVSTQNEKFSLGPTRFNLTERTFWTVALLGIFNWLAYLSSDQNIVQRYVASKTDREARKATAIYAAVALPTWILFFFIGTCVFVWYQVRPDSVVANLEPDQVFPYFLLTTIPAGLAGMTIAGVLAAAMSSLDSSINAISTVVVVDVLKSWLAKGRNDRFYLFAARCVGIGAAVLMIGGAILFSSIKKESMNDLSWIIASVFGGCLVGLFMVGFFTKRVDSFSAMVALVLSIVINVYLGLGVAKCLPESLTIPIHSYWVGLFVNLAFVVIAVTISVFRKQKRKLKGLTIWTIKA